MRVSYLELYNEEIKDLFNPSSTPTTKFTITDDPVQGANAGERLFVPRAVRHPAVSPCAPVTGPYVRGLREVVVKDAKSVMALLAIGERNRHVAETDMNARSSRSHAIFRMVIESRDLTAAGSPASSTASSYRRRSTTPTGRPGAARQLARAASLPPLRRSFSNISEEGHSSDSDDVDEEVEEVELTGTDIGTVGPWRSSTPKPRYFGDKPGSSEAAAAAAAAVDKQTLLNDGTAAPVKLSILHLVDLAGSERVGKSGEACVCRCSDVQRLCRLRL